jgi:hypothetical protein
MRVITTTRTVEVAFDQLQACGLFFQAVSADVDEIDLSSNPDVDAALFEILIECVGAKTITQTACLLTFHDACSMLRMMSFFLNEDLFEPMCEFVKQNYVIAAM